MFIQYEKNGIDCILNLDHVSAVQHEKGSNKITILGGIIMKGEQDGTQIFGHCIIDEIAFKDFDGIITGEERAEKFMYKISGKVNAIEEVAVQRATPKPPPPPRPQSEPEKFGSKTEHNYWPTHPFYMLISIVAFLLIIFGVVVLISNS